MVLRCAVNQPNRWAFRCRAIVNGERVAVHRVAGKLFQMNGPVTVKLLIPSVVLVLGTDSIPVPADRRCRLPSMAEIARQSSTKYVQFCWDLVGTCGFATCCLTYGTSNV